MRRASVFYRRGFRTHQPRRGRRLQLSTGLAFSIRRRHHTTLEPSANFAPHVDLASTRANGNADARCNADTDSGRNANANAESDPHSDSGRRRRWWRRMCGNPKTHAGTDAGTERQSVLDAAM